MPEIDFQQVQNCLAESARYVLETMFFLTVEEPDPSLPPPRRTCWVEVEFIGDPSGRFHLGLSEEAAAAAAENFLGETPTLDPESQEVRNVALELANVVCGAALSRLENDRSFTLSSPRLLESEPPQPAGAVSCVLSLDYGAAEARLWFHRECT